MDFRRSGESLAARFKPPFEPPSFPSATAIGFLAFRGVGNAIKSALMLRRLGTPQYRTKRLKLEIIGERHARLRLCASDFH
jgi:hypothetical protein